MNKPQMIINPSNGYFAQLLREDGLDELADRISQLREEGSGNTKHWEKEGKKAGYAISVMSSSFRDQARDSLIDTITNHFHVKSLKKGEQIMLEEILNIIKDNY